MNIAIYQINPDRDENNVAFLNYENLECFQGSAALRSEIYDKVFEGEVDCGTLEEVYQKVERDSLKKEIKRLDDNIKNNRKTIELIDDMKLVIRLDDGRELCVTRDMIVGAADSIDFLQAKKKMLISRLERILREIEPLELEIKEEEQQLALFPTETLADVFDRKMTDIDIDPVDVKRVISNLEKERSALNEQISQITNDSNDVTKSMIKTVQKYMGELGDSEAEQMTWKYLFTSNLKELSGAVLHKTVFSFRLAYII